MDSLSDMMTSFSFFQLLGNGAQTLLEWMSEATRLGCEGMSGRLMSGGGRPGAEVGREGGLWVWLCCFSGAWAFASIRPAALLR